MEEVGAVIEKDLADVARRIVNGAKLNFMGWYGQLWVGLAVKVGRDSIYSSANRKIFWNHHTSFIPSAASLMSCMFSIYLALGDLVVLLGPERG